MRTNRLARSTMLLMLGAASALSCGNSDEGVRNPGAGAEAGSAGLAAAGSAGASGALQTGGSGSGAGSPASGTAGVGGVEAGGAGGAQGGSGGVGQAGGTSGSSGSTATDGGGGMGAQGGQSAGGASGAAGGMPGAGSGGQSGSSGGGSGGSSAGCGTLDSGERPISFGTRLSAEAVMCSARELAASLTNPNASGWRAKGDQRRSYQFADADAEEPYRLYVPTSWDGNTELPLALFLHGAGSDENTYVDQNGQQLLELAEQHGYLLVAPLGDRGAYGNFLRLSAPFGEPEAAAMLMSQVTEDSERTNQLSERDIINVLELVLAEYPVDRDSLFLFGHSMGSGGTWYLGGKYAGYWRGLAPMSGPFVQETGYPWDDVRETFLFVTEGTQTPSLDGSRAVRDWLAANDFRAEYLEVNADHGGMVPLVLPDVFSFFDRCRAEPRD